MVEPNQVLENVFGTISLILLMLQLIPQIVHTHLKYKLKLRQLKISEKSINGENIKIQDPLEGLSLMMPIIWFVGVIFQCAYFVYLKVNVGLLIQPHVFAFFSMVIVLQYGFVNGGYYLRDFKFGLFELLKNKDKQKDQIIHKSELEMKERGEIVEVDGTKQNELNNSPHNPDFRRRRNLHVLIAFIILMIYWIVIEISMYYALVGEGINQSSKPTNLVWFITIFPASLTFIGFIMQILEIILTKSTHGLSFVFVTIVCSGSIFGVISMIFKDYSQTGAGGDYLTQFFLASLVYIMIIVGSVILVILYFVYRPKKQNSG